MSAARSARDWGGGAARSRGGIARADHGRREAAGGAERWWRGWRRGVGVRCRRAEGKTEVPQTLWGERPSLRATGPRAVGRGLLAGGGPAEWGEPGGRCEEVKGRAPDPPTQRSSGLREGGISDSRVSPAAALDSLAWPPLPPHSCPFPTSRPLPPHPGPARTCPLLPPQPSLFWAQLEEISLFLCRSCSEEVANQLLLLYCVRFLRRKNSKCFPGLGSWWSSWEQPEH